MNKSSNKKLLNRKRIRALYLNKENYSTSTSSSIIKEKNELKNNIDNNNIQLFKKNPNFRFKQDILNSNDYTGFNDLFEVYLSIKDNNQYLISPNSVNFNLDIISIKDIEIIKSLEGHKNHITTIRYFTNNINEYLISADINNIVIIWDISNENIEKYSIKLKYSNWIYSCLLFFDIDFIYIITSCCGIGNTKVYIFNNKKIAFLKNIKNSKNKNIYYLLLWKNEKFNKNYIIEFCKEKILIINIHNNNLYANLISANSKDSCYMKGFLYNSNLISNTINGVINKWDLYEKNLINSIYINNSIITNCIQWNEKYIILIDGKDNSMKIIDFLKRIVISNIYSQHEKGIICIKKFVHPIYGESLFSSGQDGYLKLWII